MTRRGRGHVNGAKSSSGDGVALIGSGQATRPGNPRHAPRARANWAPSKASDRPASGMATLASWDAAEEDMELAAIE